MTPITAQQIRPWLLVLAVLLWLGQHPVPGLFGMAMDAICLIAILLEAQTSGPNK